MSILTELSPLRAFAAASLSLFDWNESWPIVLTGFQGVVMNDRDTSLVHVMERISEMVTDPGLSA